MSGRALPPQLLRHGSGRRLKPALGLNCKAVCIIKSHKRLFCHAPDPSPGSETFHELPAKAQLCPSSQSRAFGPDRHSRLWRLVRHLSTSSLRLLCVQCMAVSALACGLPCTLLPPALSPGSVLPSPPLAISIAPFLVSISDDLLC